MEAVSDLHRLGCSLSSAFGVAAGTVPADHLNLGMLSQPSREIDPFPAVEQIQRAMGLHIDEHGAVVASSAKGEVVDAQHLHPAYRRFGQGLDQTQQRVATHCQPSPRR